MFITCQNCNTNFIIDPNQLGDQGRKVKCSKCQNVWYHKITSNENIISNIRSTDNNTFHSNSTEDSIIEDNNINKPDPNNISSTIYTDIRHGINLPVKINTKPQNHYTWQQFFLNFFTLLLFIVNISLIYLLSNYNDLIKKDSLFDFIKISQVGYFVDPFSNNFIIKYQLKNTALKPLIAPFIDIQLLDKDKKLISSHIDYWSNLRLPPSNTVNINTEFYSIKQNVGYVNITFGNRIYFLIKKIIST